MKSRQKQSFLVIVFVIELFYVYFRVQTSPQYRCVKYFSAAMCLCLYTHLGQKIKSRLGIVGVSVEVVRD